MGFNPGLIQPRHFPGAAGEFTCGDTRPAFGCNP